MRRAEEKDVKILLDVLKKDVANCIYMYINLKVYGLNNPNIDVWIRERDEKICAIVMRYHTALRIYHNDLNEDTICSICRMVEGVKHKVIFTSYSLAEILNKKYESSYQIEKSVVVKLEKFRKFDFGKVCQATEKDVDEIVSLVLDDVFFAGQYTHEGLAYEIRERMRTGMGKNYIIRQDGKIVAHNSIMAMADGVAVAGLLICHRDYRNRFLGETIESYTIKEMKDEGRELYAFTLEERRLRALEKSRNNSVACYGKLTKKHIDMY